MLYFSKRAIYIISFPGCEEVFLKFPTLWGSRFFAPGGVAKVIFFMLYIQIKKVDFRWVGPKFCYSFILVYELFISDMSRDLRDFHCCIYK
jgi:hypothetical protein